MALNIQSVTVYDDTGL